MGDLNAYMEEDPVLFLESAGYANLIRELGEGGDAYSFVFDAKPGPSTLRSRARAYSRK
jgi:predicted extracellular nuclease